MSSSRNQTNLTAKERALIKAIRSRDKKSVRELIAKGVNVNCEGGWQDHTCVSPLMFASEIGDAETVTALLRAGADVDRRDMSPDVHHHVRPNATAIHYAVQLFSDGKPSLKVLKALLNAGANPNDRYAIGDTALDIVSASGFEDAVELLLTYGGDPNATFGRPGCNALSQAAYFGHLPIVRRLLESRANPNGTSETGATALMAAAACSRAGENGFSAKVYLDVIRLLLKAGAKIDAATIKGGTALMRASDEAACALEKNTFRGQFAAVRLLIEEGNAQLNLKDSQGKTALDYASVSDFPELPDYLRERGANFGEDI